MARPARPSRGEIASNDRDLRRAALAGVATGLRATVAIAALIDAGAPGLPAPVAGVSGRALAYLGVATELVVDKLPSTPSRLEPPGLIARLAFAAVAGAVLARDAGQTIAPAVLVACCASLAAARTGHDARAAAAKRIPDVAAALAEDALALSLAVIAARA